MADSAINIIKSKVDALTHFKKVVVPHRIRDKLLEDKYLRRRNKSKIIYRKALPNERDNSQLYPVWRAGLGTFAQFGIGIGTYFMQLLILSGITLVGGLIMVAAMHSYSRQSYGIENSLNPFLLITAACSEVETVKVEVSDCSDFEHCKDGIAKLDYRPDCALPFNAAVADLVASVVIFVLIFVVRFAEAELEVELDEAVQTPQDYTVEVRDPPRDADNVDEWHEFFSRYGTVRYITISRKNRKLTNAIAAKHALEQKMKVLEPSSESAKHGELGELGGSSSSNLRSMKGNNDGNSPVAEIKRSISGSHKISAEEASEMRSKLKLKMDELDAVIAEHVKARYDVCRVYCTYNREKHQRKCLISNEVPNIYTILNWKYTKDRPVFRESDVLDICEPAEPDSILWSNIEEAVWLQLLRRAASVLATLAVYIALYFAVSIARQVSVLLLSLLVGTVDASLPMIFEWLTDIGVPSCEGDRQADIQVRLFVARLLLSTIFPYIVSPWNEVLSETFLQQVLLTQLSSSFLTPIIQLLDFAGLFNRHILGPVLSETQGELNRHFNGSSWTLAEKYTAIAKVLFLAIFYCMINPLSLFIATIAFGFVFCVDRFLLLRRWSPTCMLNSQIAVRLRQQAALAVTAHMYVSLRYLYSWPMDQVYETSNGKLRYADKFPNYVIPFDAAPEPWHAQSQRRVLLAYQVVFYVFVVVTSYILIIDPIVQFARKLFCRTLKITGESQGIPFSAESKIMAYVPLIKSKSEYYICSYVKDMKEANKPCLIRPTPGDTDDLSGYVPEEHRARVLAIVRGYNDADPEGDDVLAQDVAQSEKDVIAAGLAFSDDNNYDYEAAAGNVPANASSDPGRGAVYELDDSAALDHVSSERKKPEAQKHPAAATGSVIVTDSVSAPADSTAINSTTTAALTATASNTEAPNAAATTTEAPNAAVLTTTAPITTAPITTAPTATAPNTEAPNAAVLTTTAPITTAPTTAAPTTTAIISPRSLAAVRLKALDASRVGTLDPVALPSINAAKSKGRVAPDG